jgi:hypothetical protein
MSLKTEQPRPGAVGQPSREAVRFFRRPTLPGRELFGEEQAQGSPAERNCL